MSGTAPFEARDLPLGGSSRVPLGFQVLIGVGALVVLVAVSVVISVFLVRALGSGAAALTEGEVEYARAIDAVALRSKAMANDERGYLLSGKQEFLNRFERRTPRVRAALAAALAAADDPEQRAAVREVRDGFDRWLTAVRAEIATYQGGNREQAVIAALGPTRDLRHEYEGALQRAQQLGASRIESGAESVSTTSSQSIVILLVYLGIAVLIALAIALWLVRTILRPVYALLTIFAEPGAPERLVERYSRAQR